MIVNDLNEAGNPICICGQPVLPNQDLPEGSGQRGGLVTGSKGLVILHQVCIELHNRQVIR